MADLTPLMASVGYHFEDQSLLFRALRHPSLSADNNQRLEFVGDAVLQLAISDRLFRDRPDYQEGKLTQARQHLVCEEALADIARKINLGHYLQMDRSAESGGGREQSGALSDAMEAVLAAIYLDGGFAAAREVIDRLWPASETATEDAKSALQEYLQALSLPLPEYRLDAEDGPAHERSFTVSVLIQGKVFAQGEGRSKKQAQQAAALKALQQLQHEADS
ncbi:MAG: ribonuclease III [Clostridia bacterium]|nr:ribonuclease III [Clostridia bacterium]